MARCAASPSAAAGSGCRAGPSSSSRGPAQSFARAGPLGPVPPAPPLRSEQGVIDDWLRYIEEGVEPGISGRNNLETLAACEMVLRAAQQRRAVERSELAPVAAR